VVKAGNVKAQTDPLPKRARDLLPVLRKKDSRLKSAIESAREKGLDPTELKADSLSGGDGISRTGKSPGVDPTTHATGASGEEQLSRYLCSLGITRFLRVRQ
jgi:hypothetical protein